jgi:O-antigen/teichoic acid export membrane protein
MATTTNRQSLHSLLRSGGSRPIDWHGPLDTITASLCILGALAFFRFLIPSHPHLAMLAALASICLWRFGMHRAGILPWESRAGKRGSSFSWRQGLVEGSAFFMLMLALVAFEGDAIRLGSAVFAAIVGLVFGVYGGWYYSGKQDRDALPNS